MARLVAALVSLLALSCSALPIPMAMPPEPLPPPEVEYSDLFVNFLDESPAETWAMALTIAAERLRTDECRAAFIQHTGLDPAMLPTLGHIAVVFPQPWLEGDNLLGESICLPQRISLNATRIYALGCVVGAAVFVHEIAHIALCDQKMSGELSDKDNERFSQEIENACVWGGYSLPKKIGGHIY